MSQDQEIVESYIHYFGRNDSTLTVQDIPRSHSTKKFDMHLNFHCAKAFRIPKEVFLKLLSKQTNKVLQLVALDQMKFLKQRIKFLADNATRNANRLLMKSSEKIFFEDSHLNKLKKAGVETKSQRNSTPDSVSSSDESSSNDQNQSNLGGIRSSCLTKPVARTSRQIRKSQENINQNKPSSPRKKYKNYDK